VSDINGYPSARSMREPLPPSLLTADALFVRIERRGHELVHVYRIR
jgi:hypothetical protein